MAEKVVKKLDAQSQILLDSITATLGPILAGLGSGSGNGNQTDTSSTVTKLNEVTARALMEESKTAAGYTGEFSKADVTAFMNKFNAAQNAQIEKIITKTQSRVTPGAGKDAISQALNTVAREEYPSFFKPANFASDYIWNKVNFADSESLSGKNIAVLNEVRSTVKDFQVFGFSEQEVLSAAKDIAMGKSTIDDLIPKLQEIASIEYPNLAPRFAGNPKLTTKGIAEPVINMIAKTWEVDPSTIDLNHPLVLSYLHPGGADGKTPPQTYAQIYTRAMNSQEREFTTAANQDARNAATSMGKALGFGR